MQERGALIIAIKSCLLELYSHPASTITSLVGFPICAVIKYKCLHPVSSDAQINLMTLGSSLGRNLRMSVIVIHVFEVPEYMTWQKWTPLFEDTALETGGEDDDDDAMGGDELTGGESCDGEGRSGWPLETIVGEGRKEEEEEFKLVSASTGTKELRGNTVSSTRFCCRFNNWTQAL